MPSRRVLVLGHSGFVGSNILRRLRAEGREASGLSPADIDLTKAEDAARLSEHFEPGTAVVMCSAIKRQAGDSLENYRKNVAMAENLSDLLRLHCPGRFIFFSSTAVYGEDVHNSAITEKTLVEPTSFYGMAKYAAERLLLKAVEGRTPSPLVLLRPPTIYGPDEPGRPYGPMGFLRTALSGETITLWGDGAELREFVFIDDAVEAVLRLIDSDFSGALNLACGSSMTFQDILAQVAKIAPVRTQSRPRTKGKIDHVFDNSRLRQALPGFRFTPLPEGLKGALAAH